MIYVGRNDGKPINSSINVKKCKTVREAEDFLDWIENNVDREGVECGNYYIDVPEGIYKSDGDS